MKTVLNPHLVNKAVDIYATTPNVQHNFVADELGISYKTLLKLRKDADFWKKVWDTYLVTYEADVLDVCRAMVREALAGNTSAGRLVLEHSGKLQKNINITISSPFEQYLESQQGKQLEPSKEIQKNLQRVAISTQDAEVVPVEIQQEFNHIDRELVKKKAVLEKRRELYSWSRRAEAVGIAPMPPKRPTKGQRLEWEMSIIRAEDEQSNTNAES